MDLDRPDQWLALEKDYDPGNPVIPLKGNIAGQTEEIYGFYVERKGVDIWDMNIHIQVESGESMDGLASRLEMDSIVYPSYNFKIFL